MVEVECMINNKPISIMIDPSESLSYVSPSVLESCKLHLNKFKKSWMVQLATRTKRKVVNYVKDYEILMNSFKTQVELNVLTLGSYDILINMDWLEKNRVVLNNFKKTFTCLNEEGETMLVNEIPRKIFVRHILALQMKIFIRKGCKVFDVHVMNKENKSKENKVTLENIPTLKEFSDIFPEEIPGLPLKRELDFTIESVPGALPISKAPYIMNILELN